MVIFIIGMPGSGKTVIGEKLSKALNLPFIDTDVEFKKLIKVNPSEFRNLFFLSGKNIISNDIELRDLNILFKKIN